MVTIAWTSPENPRFALHASVGEGGKRIASLGRTAQGIMLCLYPSGASGEGRNHRVASIAQGKRFLERWATAHEHLVTHSHGTTGQPLWPGLDAS